MLNPAVIDSAPLLALQGLLACLNDAPAPCITDYLIDDAQQCGKLLGRPLSAAEDEQVLLSEMEGGAALSVYIDRQVLLRLSRHDPLRQLSEQNLRDFCTAVEGISHFQYLVWCIEHRRQVSLLELEFQAEVDKHALATWLLLQQAQGRFPVDLHRRLFAQVAFLPLDVTLQHRYQEANRCAAHFCQRNDRQYLNCRRPRLAGWLLALRELFRYGHHEKLRRALC